ncbi:putative G-protein coupled receptor 125, partial [Stegodyphus mimosarum]
MTYAVRTESVSCPLLPSSKTCSCVMKTRGLDLSCDRAGLDDLRQSIKAVTSTKENVWYLKLRNLKLNNIPGDLLGEMHVTHFIVHNSSLSSIDDEAFSGIAEYLETLDLAQNSLERVPTAALENLSNLASLNLNYNKIEILHAEAFRGLISLVRLNLFGNKIKFIDNLAFEGTGGNLTH